MIIRIILDHRKKARELTETSQAYMVLFQFTKEKRLNQEVQLSNPYKKLKTDVKDQLSLRDLNNIVI